MRAPDEIVGRNYLSRWWLLKSRWCNIYLHRYEGGDKRRDAHDHPWWSISLLLWGEITDMKLVKREPVTAGGILRFRSHWKSRRVPWLLPVFRRASHAHRIELDRGPAWTLFITGPKKVEWGYYTKTGWKHNTHG